MTLSVPIVAGTFTFSGSSMGPFALPAEPLSLAGVAVALNTRLQFQSIAGSPSTSKLVFAFDTEDGSTPVAAGTPTAGGSTGGEALPQLFQELLPMAVASCLAANLEEVDFVFATLTENMGGAALSKSAQAEWQYAVASQQSNSGQTLAVFYAASPPANPSANIPSQIGLGGNDCVIVLSQAATLDTVLIPAILEGLDHVTNPGPGEGMGPLLLRAPAATNDVSPSSLTGVPGAAGSDAAVIQAPAPIVLDYGSYSAASGSGLVTEIEVLTISDFSCAITGTSAIIAFSATISGVPNVYAITQSYNISVGTADVFGNDIFVVSFFASGRANVQGRSGDDTALSEGIPFSLGLGLAEAPLPFSIALFGSSAIDPQEGFLNGGLALAGPIVRQTAIDPSLAT